MNIMGLRKVGWTDLGKGERIRRQAGVLRSSAGQLGPGAPCDDARLRQAPLALQCIHLRGQSGMYV